MKRTAIRDLLGFTQQELSMVLNVSRSHWSLYELGQRDLPTGAMQLLAALLTQVQAVEKRPGSLPQVAQQLQQKQHKLEMMLRENEFQRETVSRKIAALQKKYNARVKVLHLVAFLNDRGLSKEILKTGMLQSIAHGTSKKLQTSGLAEITEWELKLELLELERLLLQSNLKKMTSTRDNEYLRVVADKV